LSEPLHSPLRFFKRARPRDKTSSGSVNVTAFTNAAISKAAVGSEATSNKYGYLKRGIIRRG